MVQLRAGIATSRVGFGTSRLHYLRHVERSRLLEAAFEAGIRHFDTAPAYGDGAAEKSLAPFVRNRRDRCIVVTKYGVPPDPIGEALPMVLPAWRIVRAVGRRAGLLKPQLPPLTASSLLTSVENSLRRLATDYIDILLLHEPTVARLGNVTQLMKQLDTMKTQGRIRAFGLAGKWTDVEPITSGPTAALGQIVQTGEGDWSDGNPPDITYGAISGGTQSYFQDSVTATEAEQRFKHALNRRPAGVVLVSTTRLENLQRLARVAEETRS